MKRKIENIYFIRFDSRDRITGDFPFKQFGVLIKGYEILLDPNDFEYKRHETSKKLCTTLTAFFGKHDKYYMSLKENGLYQINGSEWIDNFIPKSVKPVFLFNKWYEPTKARTWIKNTLSRALNNYSDKNIKQGAKKRYNSMYTSLVEQHRLDIIHDLSILP